MRRLLAVWLLGLGLATAAGPGIVRVRLPGGWVEGLVSGEAYVFRGLPYAHAGRWEAPRRLDGWPGVLRAHAPGPICPQKGSITIRLGRLAKGYVPQANEDCLNLNVWAPAGDPPPGGWPVMVFVHGGSFTGGSGSEPIYDGAALARRGVVVVTFNYRLGPLGFLALPELARRDPHGSTGNYGLLDQIAAFAWVRRQIAGFGGNPHNVTAFGESAGAMSLCTLLASPLARGAFDRAVLESGGCNFVYTPEEAYAHARRFSEQVGCAPHDLDCWRSLPLEELVALVPSETDFEKVPFKPVIDSYVLKEPPERALAAGRATRVPLFVGATADEYRLDATAPRETAKSTWAGVEALVRSKEGERAEAVVRSYRERFARALDAYYAYMGERILICPTYRAGRLAARWAPVYGYRFEYKSPLWPELGSLHGAELPFVFGTRGAWPFWALFMSEPVFERSAPLERAVQQAWTSFARGDPPRAGWAAAPRLGSGWLLRLGLPWGWRSDDFLEPCAVWDGANQ
ncbi:MAG TPA: carboxylesterase/lipase family protein [Oceanithermus profundus]|uniref:Carboxylesterase/lipase family protein n=1 Tax=Oceanithermus profundus TaxID=187137 RepID=A0A7C4Z459_9DEIN|nr:carboxylesterase/lipase family protein [Oceanithermus profundus]